MRVTSLLLAGLVVAPATARADYPEDVTPSSMTEHGGVSVLDTQALSEDYESVVRQLATSIATHTLLPARTLGASGFEIALDTNIAFIDVNSLEGEDPTPWERVTPSEDPTGPWFSPGITIRKGLPLSVELGLSARWVGLTRQGVFGGFVHAGLLENAEPWPDVGLHLGYTGYVGNDELELGVFDAGLSFGGSFRPGGKGKARAVELSPFLDATLLVATSTPLLDEETYSAVGAVSFGKRGGYPDSDTASPNQKAMVIPRFSGGLELEFGRLVVRVSGGYALKSVPNVAGAVGFTY